jgi:glycyl-tRNA synthetase beta chain
MNQKNLSSFLLEIGTEDLPARFIKPALNQLSENTLKILGEHYISCSGTKVYGTPRRLAVIADGIPEMQKDRIKEIFGPSVKVAYDSEGKPTNAAIGFAKSQGISAEKLIIKKKDKGEYVVAVIDEKGVPVREIIPDILRKIVLSMHFPKSMRWGDGSIRFARPIRWLLALFDNEAVKFEIEGIKSSNLTKGHRFLSPAAFQIKEISGYRKLLANNYVIVDIEERKKIISEKMSKMLAEINEKPVEDEELLDTVANLVEYPVPVAGNFSSEYLRLPGELLITVMKGHQKYFAVQDNKGNITNKFIIVSNTTEDNSEVVKAGAERVIRARFEDARFYYEEDIKKPLYERIEELKKVTFQEELGSLYEKTERMTVLAEFLADRLLPEIKDSIIRAAKLSKTDLITGVVREFPELQGIMGRYYAIENGEPIQVAEAIKEHYQPLHSGGTLPSSDAGALLSIADKIDNIAAFFSIGLIPTGSEDPFALRRQAIGIISILFDKGYEITLRELVNKALMNVAKSDALDEIEAKILQFFAGRIETILSDYGYPYDVIQAILPFSADVYLKELIQRLEALKKYKEHESYCDFLTAIKRVYNIIPQTALPEIDNSIFEEKYEIDLKEKLDSINEELSRMMGKSEYYEAFLLLSSITNVINNFFDNVLVMDKREHIKLNRLALLKSIREVSVRLADFSKLATC